jgi:hypothetical protein
MNAASRKVWRQICQQLHIQPGEHKLISTKKLYALPQVAVEETMEYLKGYYRLYGDQMAQWCDDGTIPGESVVDYLAHVIEHGIKIFLPTQRTKKAPDITLGILQSPYAPPRGPVSYVGNSGERCVTKRPVLIGEVHHILLNKPGTDWNASSSGKTHHMGVPAPRTNTDRNANAGNLQATRAGESELRKLLSTASGQLNEQETMPELERSGEFIAEFLDRNNNPDSQDYIAKKILTEQTPGRIDRMINREVQPLGGARPLKSFKHILACSGCEVAWEPFVYKKHTPVDGGSLDM